MPKVQAKNQRKNSTAYQIVNQSISIFITLAYRLFVHNLPNAFPANYMACYGTNNRHILI